MAKSTKSTKGKSAKSAAKSNGMTDAQKERLAKRVAKMKAQGKSWDEIIEATGVKGPATARKIMREFGVGQDSIRESGGKSTRKRGGSDASKGRRGKSTKATGKSSKSEAKGKTSRNRRTKGKGKGKKASRPS